MYENLFVAGKSWKLHARAHSHYGIEPPERSRDVFSCSVRGVTTVDGGVVSELSYSSSRGMQTPLFAGFYSRTAAGIWFSRSRRTALDVQRLDPQLLLIPGSLGRRSALVPCREVYCDTEEDVYVAISFKVCVTHKTGEDPDWETSFELCFDDGDLVSAQENMGDEGHRMVVYEVRR